MIPKPVIQAAQYVKNTNGGATVADFVEDNEPVGHWLWRDLEAFKCVEVREDGKIYLTEKGETMLKNNLG